MTLKEQVEFRNRCLSEFNRWEAAQPPIERSPAAILADLGFLLRSVSPEDLLRDPDPQKLGIQAMHKAMAWVKPR